MTPEVVSPNGVFSPPPVFKLNFVLRDSRVDAVQGRGKRRCSAPSHLKIEGERCVRAARVDEAIAGQQVHTHVNRVGAVCVSVIVPTLAG